MTADEARAACGLFGCISGRGEKNGYQVTIHGRIIVTDSYYLWFVNTCDEPMLFRLKYIDSFYAVPEGKRLIKLPRKFKKYLTLKYENERRMADVSYDPGD